nr:hypothetical protein [uncultured Mediterranean phage uvMED]BAR25511.1 hypothetical protein [uncultured Mediterranean phage uvMED]
MDNNITQYDLADLILKENRSILAQVLLEWNEHVYLTGLTNLSESATEIIPASCDFNISHRDYKAHIR